MKFAAYSDSGYDDLVHKLMGKRSKQALIFAQFAFYGAGRKLFSDRKLCELESMGPAFKAAYKYSMFLKKNSQLQEFLSITSVQE